MLARKYFIIACLSALALAPASAMADPMVQAVTDSPDLVVVLKTERLLYLYRDGIPIRQYPIQLGKAPEGPKVQEGDQRTPEGVYLLDWRNPDSQFYKSIHVSYPNPRDIRRSERRNVPPGSLIMIHGQPSYDSNTRYGDWTDGCIAISNEAMDELWELVPQDTPIHIYP